MQRTGLQCHGSGNRLLLVAIVCACGLAFALPARANAPSPVPGTTKVDSYAVNPDGSTTITVEGQWTWPTSASGLPGQETENDCPKDRNGVGYQVAWFDGSGSPIGNPKSPDGTILVGAGDDDTVHSVLSLGETNLIWNGVPSSYLTHNASVLGPEPADATSWVSSCGTVTASGASGTWGPITHTYPAGFAGPITFCPVMYDPHGRGTEQGGGGSGVHDITAGGDGHNADNSYEGNGEFNSCQKFVAAPPAAPVQRVKAEKVCRGGTVRRVRRRHGKRIVRCVRVTRPPKASKGFTG